MSRKYTCGFTVSDVAWRGRLWDVEVEGEYTPGRPAPNCHDHDSPAFADPGDDPEFQETYFRWDTCDEGPDLKGEGAWESADVQDLLGHGTVEQRRRSLDRETNTSVTRLVVRALPDVIWETADEACPYQAPEPDYD